MNGVPCKGIIYFLEFLGLKNFENPRLKHVQVSILVQIMLQIQINTCIQICFLSTMNP